MNKEITRAQIDDFKRRNGSRSDGDSYKNRVFGRKQSTIDEYTGERVFYTRKDWHTTKTTAQVDHITPIDRLIEQYKEDIEKGNLTIDDLREFANSDANLSITSARINTSKGKKSNLEHLCYKWKKGDPEDLVTTYNMLEKQAVSKSAITVEVATMKTGRKISKLTTNGKEIKRLSQNNFREFSKLAGSSVAIGTESGLIALTVSGRILPK